MHPFIKKIIYTEIPKDLKHPLIIPLGVIWGVFTTVLLYGFIFLFGGTNGFNKFYDYVKDTNSQVLVILFFAMTIFGLLFRLYFAVKGITQYKNKLGVELTPSYVVFCISSIIVQNIAMGTIFILTGIILYTIGGQFFDGFNLNIILNFYFSLINKVPTLIVLPKFIALILTYLIHHFFSYFWHRMAHESRLLWLLAHRPHHISTTLTSATTFEADPAFLLGLLWKYLVNILLAGLVIKLFNQNYYFVELAFLAFLSGMFEIFNHTSAYYSFARNNKFFFAICSFLGSGPYHYIHHSAEPEHSIANIGGGIFSFWDRVFGTFVYPPIDKPKIGLTKQPEIYLNPFNVTFSGLFQILYELKYNKDLLTRFKIIFGSIYFLPKYTKSFLIKDEKAYYDADDKVIKD